MHVSEIVLQNWKAYVSATFQFPAPENGANIVLVGAPNGYGKTSLLEAIVLGMYGRDGLSLIARSPFYTSDQMAQFTNYKEFLEDALHGGAVHSGQASCSIKLVFVHDNHDRTEVERVWHFTDSGKYRPNDESVRIFEGADRTPVHPPETLSTDGRRDWYRDYIAQHLLPSTLGHFFMFDGENVSVLAEREMSTQVRSGIEGLLGIPLLKELAEDLRKYANVQRRNSPKVSGNTLERLEKERSDLTSRLKQRSGRLQEVEPALAALKQEHDHLIRELATYGTGSQAKMETQIQQIKDIAREIEDSRGNLEELLMQDLALALSGQSLRVQLRKRLEAEAARETWESGKKQGDSNLDRFLGNIDISVENIDPRLEDSQRRGVREAIKAAWADLWHPPPANCADEIRHHHISGGERTRVAEFLDELSATSAPSIIRILDTLELKEIELRRLREDVSRTEAVAPEVDKMKARLEELGTEISQTSQEQGALRNEMVAIESQIHQKNAELTKLTGQMDQAKPSVRRAKCAEEVASMVDEIVAKAVPSQVAAMAKAMTKAHHSMAHSDLVHSIEINENCEVKLLNSDGVDIRRYDMSAGQKQIFTQALFSAVSSVSGRGFPVFIDTPLGRLDVRHRKRVLKHLAKRGDQVVLLSTDTEVVGEYLRVIESHVQKKYLIDFERMGEVGESSVREGYFDEAEA